MNHPHGGSASHKHLDGDEDEELAIAMAERLKDAEALAKERANSKAPSRQDLIDKKEKLELEDANIEKRPQEPGADRNIGGRKKYPTGEEKVEKEQSDEDRDVEAELNTILKKSPSKSSRSSCVFMGQY
jgi:hypothetical protein